MVCCVETPSSSEFLCAPAFFITLFLPRCCVPQSQYLGTTYLLPKLDNFAIVDCNGSTRRRATQEGKMDDAVKGSDGIQERSWIRGGR